MTRKLLLPQKDSQGKQKRQRYLKWMQELYQYDLKLPYYSFNGNLAFLTTQGIGELLVTWPSFKLTVMTIYKVVMMTIAGIYAWLKSLVKGYPFPDFKDYYFFFFKRPDYQYLENFNDDNYFGLQRVSGPNPTWIKGITEEYEFPEKLEEYEFLTKLEEDGILEKQGEKDFRENLEEDDFLESIKVKDIIGILTGKTYEEALREQRLYLADYSSLKVMVDHPKELSDGRKQFTTNPVALFYRQDNGLLQPLAIKLYATEITSATNPIYTPAHGTHWKMAKMFVQNADLLVQTVWTHSMRSHYLLGSLVMATYRNLSPNHPLFALLKPHYQDTLAVNTLIRYYRPTHKDGKIPPFGMVIPCAQEELANFFGRGMRTYSFKEMSFPNKIKKQNLEDPNLFYPYRDDGKLVWDAVHEFVREYVNLYYNSNQDVLEDFELQTWGDEIGGSLDNGKMGIPDFPTKFKTIEEIVETVGNIIFLATAQHNAVHYGLYKYVTFAPNMPYCLMEPPHTDLETPIFQEDLAKLMPPLKNVLVQSLGFYLNFIRSNRIGDYQLSQFDREAHRVIKKFQEELKKISQVIKARNIERTYYGKQAYTLMDPQYMVNSITS